MEELALGAEWPLSAVNLAARTGGRDGAALVRAARAGDRDAFDALYRRYFRLVRGVLLARLPSGDAEDLAQDVFLAAWEKLGDLRDDEGFGGWVAAIARNRAASHTRSRPRVAPLPDDLAGGPRADEGPEAVLSAIRLLPEAYRDPLVLRLLEGMSGPEIARETGLTEGSVRVNLHRGFAKLRQLLGGTR
jgi:RNA polymerase sigma-70 factor (ECF subfamily)